MARQDFPNGKFRSRFAVTHHLRSSGSRPRWWIKKPLSCRQSPTNAAHFHRLRYRCDYGLVSSFDSRDSGARHATLLIVLVLFLWGQSPVTPRLERPTALWALLLDTARLPGTSATRALGRVARGAGLTGTLAIFVCKLRPRTTSRGQYSTRQRAARVAYQWMRSRRWASARTHRLRSRPPHGNPTPTTGRPLWTSPVRCSGHDWGVWWHSAVRDKTVDS